MTLLTAVVAVTFCFVEGSGERKMNSICAVSNFLKIIAIRLTRFGRQDFMLGMVQPDFFGPCRSLYCSSAVG